MREESDIEKKLNESITSTGHVYSDARIDKKKAAKLLKRQRVFHAGYWGGMAAGRADTCLRAIRIYHNEEKGRPVLRLFSYDELVATAAMMRLGVPKRAAAAMAYQEKAIAIPDGANFDAGDRSAGDFQGLLVGLSDGSNWNVAFEKYISLNDLKFVGDYCVWFEEAGSKSDPDLSSFPKGAPTVMAFCEVDDVEQDSVD